MSIERQPKQSLETEISLGDFFERLSLHFQTEEEQKTISLNQESLELRRQGSFDEAREIDRQIEALISQRLTVTGGLDLVIELLQDNQLDPHQVRLSLQSLFPEFTSLKEESETQVTQRPLGKPKRAKPEKTKAQEIKTQSEIIFHPEKRLLLIDGRTATLDPRWASGNQPKLLAFLSQQDEPLSATQILKRNPEFESQNKVVYCVNALRRTIEKDPQNPVLLVNLGRKGYQLKATFETIIVPEKPSTPSKEPENQPVLKAELIPLVAVAEKIGFFLSLSMVGKNWIKNPLLMQPGVHCEIGPTGRIKGLTLEGQQRLTLLNLIHSQVKARGDIKKVSRQKLEEEFKTLVSQSVPPQKAGELTGLSRSQVNDLRKKGILKEGIDFVIQGDRRLITCFGLEVLDNVKRNYSKMGRINYQRAKSWANQQWQTQPEPSPFCEPKKITFDEVETAKLADRIIQLANNIQGHVEAELGQDFINTARALWGEFDQSGAKVEDCEELLKNLEEKLTALSENPGAVLPQFIASNPLVSEILMRLQGKNELEKERFIRRLIHGKRIVLKQNRPGDPVERVSP